MEDHEEDQQDDEGENSDDAGDDGDELIHDAHANEGGARKLIAWISAGRLDFRDYSS